MQCTSIMLDPSRVHKNCVSHIDVSHSRQPLVKGERLVRYEVNTVIHTLHSCRPSNALHTPCSADALMVQVLRFPCDASFPSPPPPKKKGLPPQADPRPTLVAWVRQGGVGAGGTLCWARPATLQVFVHRAPLTILAQDHFYSDFLTLHVQSKAADNL